MFSHGLSYRVVFCWRALALAGALAILLLAAGTARGDDLQAGTFCNPELAATASLTA